VALNELWRVVEVKGVREHRAVLAVSNNAVLVLVVDVVVLSDLVVVVGLAVVWPAVRGFEAVVEAVVLPTALRRVASDGAGRGFEAIVRRDGRYVAVARVIALMV